jgi:hypothetical protein
MIRKVTIAVISFMAIYLFTGCVQPDVQPGGSKSVGSFWGDLTNVDDVNMSDDNLTMSEMMMTEDGEEFRLERIAFPVSEYNRLPRMGKGTVKGSIYVTDYYDRRIAGESTRLYLNPVTSYSEQWYKESYIGGYKMEKADSRLFNYLRFTASDKNGKFAFYGVPSGSYYLIGTVKCGDACGYDTVKNIRIATQVTVQGNQIVQQDLSRTLE